MAFLGARVDGINDLRTLIAERRGGMNRQFGEARAEMKGTDQKVDRLLLFLDQKTDRQFTWLVGTRLTVLLAVVGALVTAYFR
jgi:hypothetical protein